MQTSTRRYVTRLVPTSSISSFIRSLQTLGLLLMGLYFFQGCATDRYMKFLESRDHEYIRAHPQLVVSLDPSHKDRLLLRPRDQNATAYVDIPGNIGTIEDIRVIEFHYTGLDLSGPSMRPSENIRSARLRLRELFCNGSSEVENQHCLKFLENVKEVESLDILVGTSPNYFRLLYNSEQMKSPLGEWRKPQIFFCSPELLKFSECIVRSSRIHWTNIREDLLREFGVYESLFVPYTMPGLRQRDLYLQIRTDIGVGSHYFKITYPTSSERNPIGNQSQQIRDIAYILSQTGLLSLVIFPVLLDIVIFPYSTYYALKQWGRAMGSP